MGSNDTQKERKNLKDFSMDPRPLMVFHLIKVEMSINFNSLTYEITSGNTWAYWLYA